MGLSDDEKRLLAELTEKSKQPDVDDNFEIEVYDTNAGRGARIPFKQGKGWLYETFGIGEAPAATDQGAPEGGGAGAGGDAPPAGTAPPGGYFGGKNTGRK